MMNVSEELRNSFKQRNSSETRKSWAEHIVENKIDLMGLTGLLDEEKTVSTQFSWMICDICELSPATAFRIVTHLFSIRNSTRIINFDRTLAKLFMLAGIPEEIEGEAVDAMFNWIMDPKIRVATKNYSLYALLEVVKKYNELKTELMTVIEDQEGKNSVSFDFCARKVMEKLREI